MKSHGWILPGGGQTRQRGGGAKYRKRNHPMISTCYERSLRTTKRRRVQGINGEERQTKRKMKERWRLDEEMVLSSDGTRGSNPFLWKSFLAKKTSRTAFSLSYKFLSRSLSGFVVKEERWIAIKLTSDLILSIKFLVKITFAALIALKTLGIK